MHFPSYASREEKYNERNMVGIVFSLCRSGYMLVHDNRQVRLYKNYEKKSIVEFVFIY